MAQSGEDRRKERKQSIYDLVKSSGAIELDRLMGLVSNKTGLRYETISTMVKELQYADLIEVKNNKVTLVK